MSRADFVNSVDSSSGFYYTTRIIDYEGPEQFCASTVGRSKQHVACSTRNVALNTAAGYDNMTGLGSPGSGFVDALAAAGRYAMGVGRAALGPPRLPALGSSGLNRPSAPVRPGLDATLTFGDSCTRSLAATGERSPTSPRPIPVTVRVLVRQDP
jgi:hypothetical protein